MNILLITNYFPPEIGSAAHLFYDLGRELKKNGNNVIFLTGYPRYNIKLDELPKIYRKGILLKEQYNDLNVFRIRKFHIARHIPIIRGLEDVINSIYLAFAGIILIKDKIDIILVYSPPLFLGLTALAINLFKKGKIVLNVQDLFPQSAIDLDVLKNKVLINIFKTIEKYIYNNVDSITVHSSGNRNYIKSIKKDNENIYIVPNFIDINEIKPGPRDNKFRTKYNIDKNHFLISFAGVLGYSQDIDTIIDCARTLQEYKDIVFYIVGDGVEKNRLLKKSINLKNIFFLDMLPKVEYNHLLQASDLCLVTLHKSVKTPVVPSKILSIMSAGKAMICSLPLNGDASKLVSEAKCGICIEPGRPDLLAKEIIKLYNDKHLLLEFGNNGRLYAEKNFSLEHCANLYEKIFKILTKKKG